MSREFLSALGYLLSWGVCLGSTLSLIRLPGNWGHGVCGPWGCGPPLQTLLACHLSWLVFLFPLLFVGGRFLSAKWQQRIAAMAIIFSLTLFAGFGIYERLSWWVDASQSQRRYFWHRVGFSILTSVEIPAIEILLLGVIALLLKSGRQMAKRS